ncbi:MULTISPECIES: toll/interleukin-1 receptor domain-containing protein [Flavobacteriaceae]|uniref:Toll/interleukin-1 receptor domain-containing protein n=1 Tax=Bizionia hallyeonensis TaxID=1123757 RepID=A0ABW0C572_9FLAO|nr:toll/interleukin-1 receptor domain-containing protein [Aestuariivivens sediminis]
MSLITKDLLSRITSHRKVNLSKGLGAPQILNESFNINKEYDIFLSHSYLDKEEIASLKIYLEDFGFSVYVDWIDDFQLNRNSVTKETAERIRYRMQNCKSLVYAFSRNSSLSKWMPWELGYFDGIKGRVAVLPISDYESDSFNGTEYLGIYPYITQNNIANTDNIKLWIRESLNKYVMMDYWLKGTDPILRT